MLAYSIFSRFIRGISDPNKIKHLTDTEGGVCKALKYLRKTLDNVLTKDNTVLICDNTEDLE